MERKYSTHTLFNCSLKKIDESSDVIELSEKRLSQSLNLLSTVIKVIMADSTLSEEAMIYLQKFERVENYKGKIPSIMERYWSIEEITILIIMLSSHRQKRYNSMDKAIKKFMDTKKTPTEKVLKPNREWLLDAYKYLGLLKHTNWTEEINEQVLIATSEGKVSVWDSHANIKEVEDAIVNSSVLDGELESVIGQILAKCAYPELLKECQESLSVQLVEAVSEVFLALEKVEGVFPQNIAVNESIKKLRKLTEEIEFSYDVSKYYTDAYWENIMNDKQQEVDFSDIKKMITEKYAVELDTIEKNTL